MDGFINFGEDPQALVLYTKTRMLIHPGVESMKYVFSVDRTE